jgi:hypothetical protein
MPSKKEKHQQILTGVKSQLTPLANSTNTTPTLPLSNSYQTVTTNHSNTLSTKTNNLNKDLTNSLDHRDHKHELDELNNRFSNYVDALHKKSKENNDLQIQVDTEKQKQSKTHILIPIISKINFFRKFNQSRYK